MELLLDYHSVFSVAPGDRGETDWVEMNIDPGDATPRGHPTRRVPFALCKEVARIIKEMQMNDVIVLQAAPGPVQ